MKVNLEKIEKNVVKLEIEVDQEVFGKALDKAYQKVSQKVIVPGFRKGKAPRKLVEKQVGKEYLQEEALEEVVPEAYLSAISETEIEPIDKPKIDIVQIEEGKPLIFEAVVEVKPEVELGQYIGLEVEKDKVEITEQDVLDELQRLRERHAQLINVEDGQAEMDDTVVIDFEGFIDGTPFPGGKGTDYSLELGSGTFIPGFEDQLVGVKPGETKDVNVKFPEDYHADELAGKEALFKVTVKSIKRKQLAELDDEFAKDVSEFENLQELKDDILNRLKEAAEQQAETKLKDDLVDKVVEGSQVEVPEVMVQHKIEHMIDSFSQRLSMQGMKLEDYLKYTNSDIDKVKADYRPAAEKAVKIDLVLEAIANKENIEATDADLEEKIAEMAAQYNAEPGVFRQWLENGGNIEPLKRSIVIDKTVDLLQEKAVIK